MVQKCGTLVLAAGSLLSRSGVRSSELVLKTVPSGGVRQLGQGQTFRLFALRLKGLRTTAPLPAIALGTVFQVNMSNDLLKNMPLRTRSRLRETFYLEPMQVGKSHVELKVEIYENAKGEFSSAVFASEVFLIESAFLTGIAEDDERRGMITLFVEDKFYDTSGLRASSVAEAVHATLQIVHEQLLKSGEPIEYLSDLESA